MSKTIQKQDECRDLIAKCFVKDIEHQTCLMIPYEIQRLIASFITYVLFESKILDIKSQINLLNMIQNEYMTNKFECCEWRLLYRASKDGYKASTFHDKCDGKMNTVCIVKTNYGTIAGGYVELAWSKGYPLMWDDESKECTNAYMFSLKPKAKIIKQTEPTTKEAVYHCEFAGFIFGYYDFFVTRSGGVFSQGGENYNFVRAEICGNQYGYANAAEIEVYQLIEKSNVDLSN